MKRELRVVQPAKRGPSPMFGLRPLWNAVALWGWRWAAREIHPLHVDAPLVHRRVYDLERAS